MTLRSRIDSSMRSAIKKAQYGDAPSRLSAALEDAVFPGGARIRPTILLSVAIACGDSRQQVSNAAATALELIHCASLVHDDLPCFDDAAIRRGKPSIHRAHSEPLAVLAGDSLIILAFETLARLAARGEPRAGGLLLSLAQRTGMPNGICAGQGWESEAEIDLAAYHKSKTASLFIAATEMGAISAGHDPEPWYDLGALIGEAFQIADDLRDALMSESALGKPVGQDDLHGRPNAVSTLGVKGATERLSDTLAGAIASIPSCPGEAGLAQLVRLQSQKIMPAELARHAI
ncbi:MAG: polyprenyl synthetase family protein [Pseudomonadota bacterium]